MSASMVDVEPDANAEPGRASPEDEARLVEIATALADGIDAALGPWVVRSVDRIWDAWDGGEDPAVRAGAEDAGRRAREEVGPRVRELLLTDLDEQRTTPLALLRDAVVYPTEVLRRAGVPPVQRDGEAERHFPDDDYDLAVVAFGDLDPDLAEPGLVWGAAKAHVHLARRRAEGRRR